MPKILLHAILGIGTLIWAGSVIAISNDDQITNDNIIKETKLFLPDPKNKSIKIPGRREQVLEAVNAANDNKWKSIAPGYINVPQNVILNGETITMLIDIGGLIQSKDGGKTWDYISYNLENGITNHEFFDFDISPLSTNIMVIGGPGIYKTTDSGKTWQEVTKGLPPLKYATRANGYGQVKFNSDGSRIFAGIATKVAMPITDTENLISMHYKKKIIFVSSDGGDSFREIKFQAPFSPVRRIYSHPTDPEILYVSFQDGDFYMTRNAKSDAVIFESLPGIPKGYFVRDMNVDPNNPDFMLLSLTAQKETNKNPARLMISHACRAVPMSLEEFIPKGWFGNAIKGRDFMTVSFNPNKKDQIVIGSAYNPYILISDDQMKSFRRFEIPEKFKRDGLEKHFYQQVERVYFGKSPYAVAVSKIGAWITRDNFKTIEDLTMTYEDGYFGNRGIGSPANINGLSIAKNHVYFSAQDHGAWRSNGADFTKWDPISRHQKNIPTQRVPWGRYTWFFGLEKIFSSYKEEYVYIESFAYEGPLEMHRFRYSKKFFVSHDQGKTWKDMTNALGRGDVYPAGSKFLKVLFDVNNPKIQWFLFEDALYLSKDGGKTFVRCNSGSFREVRDYASTGSLFSDIAYDSIRNVLYLSSTVKDKAINEKLNHDKTPAALYRSFDQGRTWEIYDVGQNSIKSLGVTDSGTLVVGSMKSADQPARLIVIPYGQKYSETMVKMTLGDTSEEIFSNQLSFWPIRIDGEDILAYANINWLPSDRFFAQGPLLSTDGGKSFRWINYDLPSTFIWSSDIKDGNIFIGTVSGLMHMKYK